MRWLVEVVDRYGDVPCLASFETEQEAMTWAVSCFSLDAFDAGYIVSAEITTVLA